MADRLRAGADPLDDGPRLGQPLSLLAAGVLAGGDLLLDRGAALPDLLEALLDAVALGPRLGDRLLRGRQQVLLLTQLAGDELGAELGLLGDQLRGPLGRLGLALQRPHSRARLALDVERAVEVVASALELQLRAVAALAVLAETGGLLDQQPAVAGLGVDDRLHPALADHRVHLAAHVGVGEDLEDVGEAAAGAVQPVLALAGCARSGG